MDPHDGVKTRKMLDSALVPIGFTESTGKLRTMVQSLELLGLSRVVLLHIGSIRKHAEQVSILEQRAGFFREAGIEPEILVSSGSPALRIPEIAGQEGLDCIVFSWKYKTRLQRTVTGSTTLDVIRLSKLPVFVNKGFAALKAVSDLVLPDSPDASSANRKTVIYATDFGPVDAAVVPYLSTENLPVEKVILLHVGARAPDPVAEHRRVETVRRNLDRLAGECRIPEVETLSVTGNPRKEIIRYARRLSADAIFIGKSDSPRGFSSILGSVAEAVAYGASCSVLIVPNTTGAR